MSQYHIPVMMYEVLDALDPKKGKVYIDATFGGGGHAKAMLDQEAIVFGFDQDEDAIQHAHERNDIDHSRLTLINKNFDQMREEMKSRQIKEVDGILFDLGVSSHQVDTQERGFSFQLDAPLDMRMSQSLGVTAKDLINGLGKRELYDLFTKYGDEKLARPISEAIVRARQIRRIDSTKQLASLVDRVYGGRRTHLHPATKVFQALRIAINDELNTLKITLPQATELIKSGGKLVVISFHEGEDRIVKHFMQSLSEKNWEIDTKKPLVPSPEEVQQNPRSRSAKLRIATKR